MSRIMDLLVIGTAVLTANLSNARAEGPAAETLEWTLRTADTTLSVGIDGERGMVIRRLCGPDGWNWTAADSPLPLIGRIDVAEVQTIPKWNYRGAAVDKSDGRQLTITFANALPAMELKSVWQARPGPGPIRQAMFITNRSDKPVTIYEQESLQVHLASPGQKAAEQTTLTCIKNDASVPDATGVYREPLVRGYRKELPIAEHDGSFIPFVAVDAGGRAGVYLGWEWSIGRIAVTGNAASGATIKVGNGDGFRTNLAPGATFEVPPAFIGAYRGDLDDAANSLHKYLFRYSMPPALRNDPAYPRVEWNAFAATGQGQGSWQPAEAKYYPLIDDIAPLGFEDVVIDVNWWNGDVTHQPHPPVGHAKYWPKGMRAACDYAHRHGLRFGLYWNCNPSMTTAAGMRHRQDDFKSLYDKFHIDFYPHRQHCGAGLADGRLRAGCRSHYAEDLGYWQTKGFYEVTDGLQATLPNLGYENCSSGGSIKDFGVMRRALRIQDQDRYYPVDARRAFYDASYALHPMQIATISGSWAEWQATGSVYEFRSASLGAALLASRRPQRWQRRSQMDCRASGQQSSGQ